MLWFIVIVVVLIVVSSISGASKRAKRAQERTELIVLSQSRAAAYAAYLKRTSQHPTVAGMTDSELQDFLQTHIRQYQAERKGISEISGWISGGGMALGIILGVAAQSFGLWIAVFVASILIGYFHDQNQTQALDQKYRQIGLDPNQLRV